ncbi:MAG TPA: PEP-utilizing enzyme [Pseudonocardia sp.]|jgi:pyruvate,water dikinase|nr:PEP-utilizing enzyme [Pseudonocardia sp.]
MSSREPAPRLADWDSSDIVATPWVPGRGDRLLDNRARPASMWTTTNIAELMPGVPTPLGWSVFAPAAELAMRRAFHALGALNSDEVSYPADEEDLVISIFHGHPSMSIDFLCEVGDRMPGGSGLAIAQQFFSSTPEGFESKPTRRYYPRVAVRLPLAAIGGVTKAKTSRASAESWWRKQLVALPQADLPLASQIFREACAHYEHVVSRHVLTLFALVQPVYEQLSNLIVDAPHVSSALQAGYGGHEESAMLNDLWACAKGRVTINQLLERHGYHGPRGGELSAVVWREDPAPLQAILDHYRPLDDDKDPLRTERTRVQDRQAAEIELLQTLPFHKRARARVVLRLAGRYMPLRSIGKVAYLQCFDVARASARRIGQHLQSAGLIGQAEDVFYLTAEELLRRPLGDVGALIDERRKDESDYRAIVLPTQWLGHPEALRIQETSGLTQISGQGVSAGTVTGRVRVVTEPGETEMEPGEILVGHVTDPSWSSIMFLSSALVADIGGQLSHTAVVARELGIPCVVDTKIATKALNTGDLCRVDGSTGTIEILERAGEAPPAATI